MEKNPNERFYVKRVQMVGSGGGLHQPSWKGGAPVISWQ